MFIYIFCIYKIISSISILEFFYPLILELASAPKIQYRLDPNKHCHESYLKDQSSNYTSQSCSFCHNCSRICGVVVVVSVEWSCVCGYKCECRIYLEMSVKGQQQQQWKCQSNKQLQGLMGIDGLLTPRLWLHWDTSLLEALM